MLGGEPIVPVFHLAQGFSILRNSEHKIRTKFKAHDLMIRRKGGESFALFMFIYAMKPSRRCVHIFVSL